MDTSFNVDNHIATQLGESKKTAAEKAKDLFAISRNATAMSMPFITGANLFRATEIINDTTANVVTGIGAIGLLGSGVLYMAGRSALRKQQKLENLEVGMQGADAQPSRNTSSIANSTGPEAMVGEKAPAPAAELAPQAAAPEQSPQPYQS